MYVCIYVVVVVVVLLLLLIIIISYFYYSDMFMYVAVLTTMQEWCVATHCEIHMYKMC